MDTLARVNKLARGVFAFLQQAQEQVLGADDLAALLTGLVPGQEEDPLRLLGELLEHEPRLITNRRESAGNIA